MPARRIPHVERAHPLADVEALADRLADWCPADELPTPAQLAAKAEGLLQLPGRNGGDAPSALPLHRRRGSAAVGRSSAAQTTGGRR